MDDRTINNWLHAARVNLRTANAEGEEFPPAFSIMVDGEQVCIGAYRPWENAADKRTAMAEALTLIPALRGTDFLTVFDAYVASVSLEDAEEFVDSLDEVPLSERPDRDEALIAMAAGNSGEAKILGITYHREDDGSITFEETQDLGIEFDSWMVNAVRKAFDSDLRDDALDPVSFIEEVIKRGHAVMVNSDALARLMRKGDEGENWPR